MLEEFPVPSCEYEERVVAALGASHVPEPLAAHMENCPVCRDVKLVFRFLESAATEQQEDPSASAAGLIWWRARLYEKRALAARSVKPIRTVQTIAIVLTLAMAAIFAVLAGPAWIGKAPPLVIAVMLCGCGLIVSAAGLWTFWTRTAK